MRQKKITNQIEYSRPWYQQILSYGYTNRTILSTIYRSLVRLCDVFLYIEL